MEGPNSELKFDQTTNQPFKLSGILPRTAIFIWDEITRYRKQFGLTIFIEVSALEIYCETIRDLLWEPTDKKDKNLTTTNYVEMKTIGNKVQCIGQTWLKVDSPQMFL